MQRFFFAFLLMPVLLAGGPTAWAGVTQEAVLAGGCFWCLEHDLESVPGVLSAESGYSGGYLSNPTYRQVSGETTGHQEVVRVRFDSGKITFATLLRHYWRNVDPLDGGGQFCDRGDSYRPVIFTEGSDQAAVAQTSAAAVARELKVPLDSLKVQIRPAAPFWPAEDYHQNYADRNPIPYNYYRFTCGRDRRLDQVWGKVARTGNSWLNQGQ
ncbi:MAG: peptide-methionine (S)-S-oxide reductase MsrA [Synechococcus sp.]